MSNRSVAERIANLPYEERKTVLGNLTPELREALRWTWRFWARPEQVPPLGDWRFWLILSGRGWGKALALDTPVPTSTGWTTMGSLKVGDSLFDETGRPCTVTYVAPVQLGRPCYDVVFSDGAEVVADADHEWFTWTHAARKSYGRAAKPTIHPGVVNTAEIRRTLTHRERGDVNHSIDVAGPLQLAEADLPIEPYVLGAWLGDGHSHTAAITCADEGVMQAVVNAGYAIKPWVSYFVPGKCPTYSIGTAPQSRGADGRMQSNNSIHSALKRMNLLRNKHIPTLYLRASFEQRLALLQGLMDTDGYAQPNGNCEYTTICRQLADDVYELATTLGIKATVGVGRATLNGKDCGEKYRISFTPYIPVFRLPRKLERLHTGGAQKERQLRRYVVDVRERESVPVVCIQVDSPSHLFLVSRAMIPTHNTRTGVEWVRQAHKLYPRIHMVGRTTSDVRDVMVDGPSGILRLSPEYERPTYNPTKRRLTWPNGSVAVLFSSDEPEQLRGPQCHAAWGDEVAAWTYAQATYDQLLMGLRLGANPRAVFTTTPRPIPLVKRLVKDPTCVVTRGTTYENVANLAPSFIDSIIKPYEGTRLGRQELLGEIVDDVQGALWTMAIIHSNRVEERPKNLVRVVVAVDPGISHLSQDGPAETGIVVAGRGDNDHYYVLADWSIRGTPEQWASQAIRAFHTYKADRIVGEVNQGGDMVESTLRTVDPEIPFRKVSASRGKTIRAEPVSALYEQGKVHHVGIFPILEDQMCTYIPGMKSPDHMDACVYTIIDLMDSYTAPPMDVDIEVGHRESPWAI